MSRDFGKPTNLVDVYSFAMIILELVSLKLPFDDWEDAQVITGVPNGERPDIPFDCNIFFKNLMIDCWQSEPNKRPPFLQILERLKLRKGEPMWPIEYPNLQKPNSVSICWQTSKSSFRYHCRWNEFEGVSEQLASTCHSNLANLYLL
jgi:hypothetical protein